MGLFKINLNFIYGPKPWRRFILKFFTNFFLALLIALIPTIWVIQNDYRIQMAIKNKLIELFQKEWNAKIEVESSNINLFTGTVVLKNGFVKAKKDKIFWWKFKKAYVKFSRLGYFLNDELILKIRYQNIAAETVFSEGKLAIIDHLKDIFSPSTRFVVDLKSVKINNLKLNIIDKCDGFGNLKNYFLDLEGSFNFKKMEFGLMQEPFWHGFLNVRNGNLLVDRRIFLDQIMGKSSFYQLDSFAQNWNLKTDLNFKCLGFNKNEKLNLCGEWGAFNKCFNLKSQRDFWDVKITSTYDNKIDISGSVPLESIKNLHNFLHQKQPLDLDLTGTCKFDINTNITKAIQSSGKIRIKNLKLSNKILGTCNINFGQTPKKIKNQFCANLDIPNFFKKKITFSGNGSWDINKRIGKLFLKNSSTLNIDWQDSWAIMPNDFCLSLKFCKNSNLLGKYKLCFFAQNLDKTYSFKGNCFFNKKDLKVSGKTLNGNYVFQGQFRPEFYLTKLLYESKGERLIDIFFQKDKCRLDGKIKYSFIRSFLPMTFKRNILGKSSTLFFLVEQNGYNFLKGNAKLCGGKLSILGSYNPLQQVKFNFGVDFLSKKIFLNDLAVKFFKGSISCSQASINLKDDYEIDFIHFPLQIDDMLINFKKDFYGIVYGNLLLSKKRIFDQPEESFFKVFGDLILKRSLFKENVFFQEESSNYFVTAESIVDQDQLIEFDINLSNEKFLKAKTSFVHANANLDLNLHSLYFDNKFAMPQVKGNIDLQKGTLNFLRHQLYIHYGKIQFIPSQINEPIIDLVAQNRIKKYLISLQASGSLRQPNIILESSPELSEEQILALLIAGTENASFQADLPAIFMQNLNNLIMGSKDILPKGGSFIRKITLPLKYIQITPNFTNPAGYGGIKGIVSIDLNNQIHAQVQKNFNLQEDFAFQIEYLLTDDINLKFVRDQSGEIGSEVEVRFKF